jgi:hypothetical protein
MNEHSFEVSFWLGNRLEEWFAGKQGPKIRFTIFYPEIICQDILTAYASAQITP